MTNLAREKHADYMMKVSSSIFTALMVTILIVPLLEIVKSNDVDSYTFFISVFKGPKGYIFAFFEIFAVLVSGLFRTKALTIYNQLDQNKEA